MTLVAEIGGISRFAGACNTAVELTEQPGSGLHRHVDPHLWARMGAWEPLRDLVWAFTSDSAHDHHKPANPRSPGGPALARPLTRPDPMGAQTAPASTRWTIPACLVNNRSGDRDPRQLPNGTS
jgi:hypothetical protein